ncbi:anti-sigma factor family protein [Kineococcus gypseus]|uniref:anti-sigma factor family protein n=1 Tax=Kineococcus gypseus TaxID=1637102 RepID=UPI003D7DCD28
MSGPHLGARVSPLVDGRLAPDAAVRAGEHLRACADCAEAVEAERLVRARLRALPDLEPSADLLVRLRDIGGPGGPLPPRDRPMAVPARPAVGAAPPARADLAHPPARTRPAPAPARRRRVHRRPVAAALAGTFSLLGVGIAGFLVLGGQQPQAPAPVAELRTTPSSAPVAPRPSTSPAVPGAPVPVPAAPATSAPADGAASPVATSPAPAPERAAPSR